MWLNTLPNGILPRDVVLWWDGGPADRKNGNPHTAAGLVAGTEKFGGLTQTFAVDDDVSVNAGNAITAVPLTIVAWVKRTVDSDDAIFITKNKDDGTSGFYFRVTAADNKMGLLRAGVAQDATGDSVIDGNWHQLGISSDAAGVYTFYLDGEIDGTGTELQTYTFGTNVIGNQKVSVDDESLNGEMGPLIVFNKILTNDQVRQMYNKHKAGV